MGPAVTLTLFYIMFWSHFVTNLTTEVALRYITIEPFLKHPVYFIYRRMLFD